MKKLVWTIVIIIALGAGWYFLSPLFIDEVVDEEFPEAQMPTEEALAEMTDQEKADLEKKIVEEMADQPTEVDEEMPEEAEPSLLLSGNFKDGDSFHKGSGEAGIYELADGSHVLRFENFSVTNGPDLYVYLASHSDPQNRDDLHSGEYLELSKLKGNIGNQNYIIPEDADLETLKTIVIYCKPFHVVFSTALLE